MTLEQLELLLKRAEEVTGEKFVFDRNAVGGWNLYLASGSGRDDVFAGTLDACVARLKQWATPPKPKTLTFTLPTDYCETALSNITKSGSYECHRAGSLHNALVAALKPYQQPE